MAQKIFNFPFVDNYNESSGPFISFRPCYCEGGNGGNSNNGNGLTESEVQDLISDMLADKQLRLVYRKCRGEYELMVGNEVKGVITIPEDKHISDLDLVDGKLVVNVDGMDEPMTVDFSHFVTDAAINEAIDKLKNGASEEYDTFKEVEDELASLKDAVKIRPTEEEVDSKIKEAMKGVDVIAPDLSDYAKKDELPVLDDYAKKDELPDLSDYVTKDGLPEFPDLSEYVKTATLPDFGDFAKKDDVPDMTGYVKMEDLPGMPDVSGFATVEYVTDELKKKQNLGYYLEYKDENGRKVFTLSNADIFGARANTEPLDNKVDVTGWISLIQLNRWNVVDIGSPKTITNINTPKGMRPTVQEAGQSGSDAYHIAYFEDLPDLSDYYTKKEIEDKDYISYPRFNESVHDVSSLKFILNQVLAGANRRVDAVEDIKKTEKGDLLLSGEAIGNPNPTSMTKYSVADGDMTLFKLNVENVSLELTCSKGDLTIEDFYNSGVMSVSGSRNSFSAYCNGYFSLRNCYLNAECYNGLYLNGNGKYKITGALIENVVITHTTNNALLILATDDYAILDIKSIAMKNVKNAIRLSNYTNAKDVIVNIEDVDVTLAREKFLLLEDYVTRKEGDGLANDNTDLFKTMKINIRNCKCNGQPITKDTPVSEFCQMVVGRPSAGADIPVSYEEHPESFPTFNIV